LLTGLYPHQAGVASGTLDPAELFAVTDALGNYSLDVNLSARATFRLME
jgi:hypothetical protein